MISNLLRENNRFRFVSYCIYLGGALLSILLFSIPASKAHIARHDQSASFLLSYRTNGYVKNSILNSQFPSPQSALKSDFLDELKILLQTGNEQIQASQFQDALETYTEMLGIVQSEAVSGEKILESLILGELGQAYFRLGHYSLASDYYQQAISHLDSSSNDFNLVDIQRVKARILYYQSELLRQRGRYLEALEQAETALKALDEWDKNSTLYGMILWNIGIIYDLTSQYESGAEQFHQALIYIRSVPDPYTESRILYSIGANRVSQGAYSEAEGYFQESLALAKEVGSVQDIANAINGLGMVASFQGDYEHAFEEYEAALDLQQDIGSIYWQGITLRNIGATYWQLGDFDKAEDALEQALQIQQTLQTPSSWAYTLVSLGLVQRSLGNYAIAKGYLERALEIFDEIGNLAGVATALDSLAGLAYNIGEFETALNIYRQAFSTYREIGARPGIAVSLNNIGLCYGQLGDFPRAYDYFQQSLATYRAVGDRAGIATTIANLGWVHQQEGEVIQALNALRRAISIRREIGDRAGEATALNNAALIYEQQEQYTAALDTYREALAIFREIGEQAGEHKALANIGYLLEQQGAAELAIVFYKDAVRVAEQIRADLQGFSLEQQQTYTKGVAATYRRLANLLLSQGRILEAQQILELLKLQELETYLESQRSIAEINEVFLLPAEEYIIEQHGSLIAFSQVLNACEKTMCEQLADLRDQKDNLNRDFRIAVRQLEEEIRNLDARDDSFLDPSDLSREAREIIEAQPGTALIYPLVLEDRLWLLWITEGGVVSQREISGVGRADISAVVLQLREQLRSPFSNLADLQVTAQQLYRWLIADIEDELQSGQIQHLVFALDRSTRYIPMAVLFDGEQYLVEKFNISTILSAELTEMDDRLSSNSDENPVLAVGVTEASEGFSALPFVQVEIDEIVRQENTEDEGIYPGVQLLNQAFDFRSLRDHLSGRRILHIATHGKFIPGRRDESFLLLGNGERLPIPEIEVLSDYLSDVHLVVLSACETALGGTRDDGIEIAGTSFYFLQGGAEAVMASLWKVSDSSTSLLMQRFYESLASGESTKAEALRHAQLSLIEGDDVVNSIDAGRSIGVVGVGNNDQFSGTSNFQHPFYWSPFVIIGNSL